MKLTYKITNQILKIKKRKCDQSHSELIKQQQKLFLKRKKEFLGTATYDLHSLKSVNSYSEYVTKVNRTTYNDYLDLITRMEQGQANLLHRGRPTFFGMTSGTTGKSKSVPYNKESVRMFANAQAFTGGTLSSVSKVNPLSTERFSFGACPVCKEENGFQFGYISGYLNKISPYLLRRKTFPSNEALAETDWDKKIKMILDESLNRDIEIITGVPTFVINVMERVLEHTGKKEIKEIWPNLRSMVYGAFPVNNHKERINELVGNDLKFYGIYASTEAPIGVPFEDTQDTQLYTFIPGLLLSFSPVSNLETNLGVEGLKENQEYYLRIGMPNGFLNYDLQDVIRIKSLNPVVTFEVIGRTTGGMNITAEKVSEKQLLDTVVNVKSDTISDIAHYLVSPTLNGKKPCYQWTLFLENINECHKALSEKLDSTLRQISGTYQVCREEGVLGQPLVKIVESSALKKYFDEHKNKGQFKMKTTFKEELDYSIFMNSLLGVTT